MANKRGAHRVMLDKTVRTSHHTPLLDEIQSGGFLSISKMLRRMCANMHALQHQINRISRPSPSPWLDESNEPLHAGNGGVLAKNFATNGIGPHRGTRTIFRHDRIFNGLESIWKILGITRFDNISSLVVAHLRQMNMRSKALDEYESIGLRSGGVVPCTASIVVTKPRLKTGFPPTSKRGIGRQYEAYWVCKYSRFSSWKNGPFDELAAAQRKSR